MKTHSLFGAALIGLMFLIAPAQAIETVRTPITLENADQMTMTHMLGRGRADELLWSPDESRLAVTTDYGTWLYDALNWTAAPVLLGGERYYVQEALFDPTGKFFITARHEHWSLWDLAANKRVATVSLIEGGLRAIAISPDGRYFVTVSEYSVYVEEIGDQEYWSALVLWEIETRQQVSRVDVKIDNISDLDFSPDGEMLLVGPQDEAPSLYRVEDLLTQTSPEPVLLSGYEAFSDLMLLNYRYQADGDVYALYQPKNSGQESQRFELRNETQQTTLVSIVKPSWRDVIAVAYSPASNLLAVSGNIGRIDMYDVTTGSLIGALPGSVMASRLAFNHSGDALVAYTSRNEIKVWDLKTGTSTLISDLHMQIGYLARFHPDSERIAFATRHPVGDIQLWEIDDEPTFRMISVDAGWPTSLVFHPEGTQFAVSGGLGCCPEIWDLETNEQARVFIGHENDANGLEGVEFVSFVEDGTRLLSGGSDGTGRLWDTDTGEVLAVFPHEEGDIRVHAAGLVSNGQQVLTFAKDDFGVSIFALWDGQTGEKLESPFDDGAEELVFSRDGTRFMIRDFDMVRVYDSHTMMLLSEFRVKDTSGITTFSPDGVMLAIIHDGSFTVYQISTGKMITEQDVVNSGLFDIDWSPDGTRIALTGREGAVFIFGIE